MTGPPPSRDLARITLGVLFIGLMIVACLWVLRPFIAATIWAATVVVATWPLMLGVQSRLGGRRWLAVAVMTGAMLLLLVVPLILAVSTIIDYADDVVEWVRAVVSAGVPAPPEWVRRMPLAGAKLLREWERLRAASQEDLAIEVAPYVRTGVAWLADQAGGFGLLLLHFLLTVVITAILVAAAVSVGLILRNLAEGKANSIDTGG